MALVARVVALTAVALGSGCDILTDSFQNNDFSGDEFPISVDLTSGALHIGIRQPGGGARPAVLDVLSPLTVFDPGPGSTPSIDTRSLILLDVAGTPRARFDDKQVVSLHPCNEQVAPCVVGSDISPTGYTAILGADALAGDAVRLRLGANQMFVLPDIGGDAVQRTLACDGVFSQPFRGGGTLRIGGTELSFGGRRIALATCLGDNPDPAVSQAYRGADVLLVASTGIGPSMIGESAYRRYIDTCAPGSTTCPAPLETLPETTLNLPSGPVSGRQGTIANLALVAASSSTPRAACRQVYAHHFMVQRDCAPSDDCPCEDGARFCGAPAVLHLAPAGGIAVLVVDDANDTLQALRTELRPNQAEVDGILGTSALLTAEIDVDYPHNRVLARCTDATCVTRPQLNEESDRDPVSACLPPGSSGPVF